MADAEAMTRIDLTCEMAGTLYTVLSEVKDEQVTFNYLMNNGPAWIAELHRPQVTAASVGLTLVSIFLQNQKLGANSAHLSQIIRNLVMREGNTPPTVAELDGKELPGADE